jgi:DNA-binding MarR family transcriptional regulator
VSLPDLDPVIHPPKRLAITAMLVHAESADFAFLRDALDVSDSDLSKQMATLERAGYVSVRKTRPGRGASTTYRITPAGRAAFARHLQALQQIAGVADGHPAPA